jgi:hypothetical protein
MRIAGFVIVGRREFPTSDLAFTIHALHRRGCRCRETWRVVIGPSRRRDKSTIGLRLKCSRISFSNRTSTLI